MIDIKNNLLQINEKIRNAEAKSGRKENSVKLMAVSKFHLIEEIQQAIDCGQLLFGENKVQEANQKFPELFQNNQNIELQMIGVMQSNKVKNAVKIASCIQSVDRIDLLNEIEKQCAKIEKNINILFEIHTGEETKSGFECFEDVQMALNLFSENKFPHITPKGFMTMAPFTEDKSLIHKSFETVYNLSQKLQQQFPSFDLSELSMGMSGDFEIAIEHGSTLVRVGTAIFGERDYSKK